MCGSTIAPKMALAAMCATMPPSLASLTATIVCSVIKRELLMLNVTAQAMARSADEAELMARSLVMSHSLLVEQVLSVKLKKSQQALESSTTETILHRNALLRNPPCAMIFSVHKKGIASREIHLSPDPASDHLKQ